MRRLTPISLGAPASPLGSRSPGKRRREEGAGRAGEDSDAARCPAGSPGPCGRPAGPRNTVLGPAGLEASPASRVTPAAGRAAQPGEKRAGGCRAVHPTSRARPHVGQQPPPRLRAATSGGSRRQLGLGEPLGAPRPRPLPRATNPGLPPATPLSGLCPAGNSLPCETTVPGTHFPSKATL